ncbi:hypothetical protein GGI17_003901 [Coemansia sp. S146]|nr:hypothetical protein GGI17_003901 [Coemansia sp. S146]
MKTSFAAISYLAVAVLAQSDSTPVVGIVSPARQAPVHVSNIVTGQMPQIPQVSQLPSSLTQSLLTRLVSYFDMSHLPGVDTTTPVMVTQVFDPTMNKFTHLSMNIVQSGNVWYLPVCTVDSITAAAGASVMLSVPESCQYGIQLAPVPQNAMKMMMRVMRTMFRAINAAAMEPTRFWFGRPSIGMTSVPDIPEQ